MENNIFEVSDIESFEKKLSQVREAQKSLRSTPRNRLIKFLRRLQ